MKELVIHSLSFNPLCMSLCNICIIFKTLKFKATLFCFCSRVMTYREHGAWVVKAHLQKETDGHIISVRCYLFSFLLFLFTSCQRSHTPQSFSPVLTPMCPISVNGDVRFFEPRTPDSINVLQTVKGLTALDIHPQANLFAW